MGTVILLLLLAVVPCLLSSRQRSTTEFLNQNVDYTGAQSRDVVISTEQYVSIANGDDLGMINESFFNMYPKTKIMRFLNQTLKTTALIKPPKTKHFALRTLDISHSVLLDNAYTFALYSLVELETFILHNSILESQKIDSRFLEGNVKLKTIDIRETKFEFGEEALYNLTSLVTLNIVKCGMKRIPQSLLSKKSQLREMNLSGNKLKDVLSQFMFPESIEILTLVANGIKILNRYDFSEMVNLKVLFLDDNLITYLNWNTFSDLKNIENLSLGNNFIEILTERHFKRNRKLKALDLSFNCIRNVREIPWTFNVFFGLQKNEKVEGRVIGNTSCNDV